MTTDQSKAHHSSTRHHPNYAALKHSEAFLPLITRLINLSLPSGTFPQTWKRAIVKTLLKKIGLENIFKNYSPVSNLNFISKLLEGVVCLQIQEHLYKQNMLPQYQSSYWANYSTETLLLKLIDDVLKGMEAQEVTAPVALDLNAAYDTVDHELLLVILRSHFGIYGIPLTWIKSYLDKRSFQVEVGSTLSEPIDVPYAVQQGSLLGPVLFVCYIATLQNIIQDTSSSLLGYADDHTVHNSFLPIDEHLALENLSVVTDKTRNWMKHSFLKMNDSKMEIVIFGTRNQCNTITTTAIDVGDTTVNISPDLTYLGVLFDHNLMLKSYILSKAKKASYYLYSMTNH